MLYKRPLFIESVNEFKINLIDLTASSFPGIGISTKSGSQFVSKIEIIGIPNFYTPQNHVLQPLMTTVLV